MAGYVFINIDTTSPNIEIYAPSYTTNELLNEITIQANEQLSLNNSKVYAIDSNGVRYDYTFQLEGDKYVGYVKFSDVPVGSIVTLYAQVADDYDNVSNLISKAVFVANQVTKLSLDIDDKPFISVSVSDEQRKLDISDEARNIEIADIDRSETIGTTN